MLERLFGEESGGIDLQPAGHHRRLEEFLLVQHQPQVWAAKFTARHPNLVASKFPALSAATTRQSTEWSKESSRNPARRTSASKTWTKTSQPARFRIRVETIDYFLRRYREEIIKKRKAEEDIEAQLAALEAQLRGNMSSSPPRWLQISG